MSSSALSSRIPPLPSLRTPNRFSIPSSIQWRPCVSERRRKTKTVLCASTAPPRNWDAVDGNNSARSNELREGGEVKEGADVLIECRDVHKSFGEKQILRGVSFKKRRHSQTKTRVQRRRRSGDGWSPLMEKWRRKKRG